MNHLFVERNTDTAGESVEPLEGRYRPFVRDDELLGEVVDFSRGDAGSDVLRERVVQLPDNRTGVGNGIHLVRRTKVNQFAPPRA